MISPARTRYAPSPTGRTHLGNLRTALFSWLLARHTGGQFILRIEDTDRERLVPGAQEELLDALRWLGLDWDEGPDIGGPHAPYVQSENLPRYQAVAQQLIASGHAYYCDCTPERLETVRTLQAGRGQKPRYDNYCRERGLQPGPNMPKLAVRLRLPTAQGTATFEDALRGPIRFASGEIGDPVILKSDGYPTYHLASVVDDHDMRITHVLRGEEWLSSTPIHVNLYAALGWTTPIFVHLPIVTDFERRKIKKRLVNDTPPPESYEAYAEMARGATLRARGYLPEAVLNYLAFLGWNPGTTEEIMTPAEIVARFSLERLSASPAVFDVDRLNWFNQQHLKRLSNAELAELALPFLRAAYGEMLQAREQPMHALLRDPAWLSLLVEAVRDELVALADVAEAARFVFIEPVDYTPDALAELRAPTAGQVLAALSELLSEVGEIAVEDAEALLKALRERMKQTHALGGKQVMMPIRAALTGTTGGPHLAHILALLGAQACRRRIDRALDSASQRVAATPDA